MLEPLGSGFFVGGQAVALVAAKHRHVESILVQAVALGEQLPSPVNRFGLEVVAKRPVAEHLEQRVVVRVDAHFFQVVVFAADTEALLRVCNPCVFHGLVAEEQILEGVHARVDEHQRGVVLDHHGC